MLAGRKLLLADDSVTIQKVIQLTFADEGVRVVVFSDGQEAIDRLEEEAPDIVLADVFMPKKTGYDVCEYVKQNEKLNRIPVMLLVGSFEPFDEAEARRVGADDILTKPFQSIRRLIDRVGALVSAPPAERETPTAELPHAEEESTVDKLNTEELAISTADTRPLPEELQETLEMREPVVSAEPLVGEKTMETQHAVVSEDVQAESSDVLLDLGELEPAEPAAAEEFVLDLDMEDTLSGHSSTPAPVRAFVEPQVTETVASGASMHEFSYQPQIQQSSYSAPAEVAYEDQVHEVAVEPAESYQTAPLAVSEPEVSPSGQSSPVAPDQLSQQMLSQQMIDAIARRVVEMMSEKVVQEVAWEVVPDLAELMIKRRLEEKESPAK